MFIVNDLETYKDIVKNNYKVIVIFCHAIQAVFKELAYKYHKIIFVIVIINNADNLAKLFNITSTPLYYFYHNSNLVKELKLLKETDIKELISF
jgi:hypothetical protein